MSTGYQYKKDILNRMGGPRQYSIAIFGLSERLVEDPTLKKFYKGTNMQGICQMQKAVLDMALEEMHDDRKQQLYNRIMLHHYNLFISGLSEHHFDTIKQHLRDALRCSWTEQDVIDDILYYFEELRGIFFGVNGHCSQVLQSLKQDNDLITQIEAKLAAC